MLSILPTSCPLAASFSRSSLISLSDRPGSGRPRENAVVDPVPAYGALREVDEGFPEHALRPVGPQDFRILPRTGEKDSTLRRLYPAAAASDLMPSRNAPKSPPQGTAAGMSEGAAEGGAGVATRVTPGLARGRPAVQDPVRRSNRLAFSST